MRRGATRGGGWLVATLVAGALGCGETDDKESSEVSTGGTTSSGGSGGASVAGMPGSGSAGRAVISMAGTGPATLPVNPPASVNLSVCSSIAENDTSYGVCVECCFEAGLYNVGFFQGACACSVMVDNTSVCATATSDADTCFACCHAADYSGGAFNPDPPAECGCHSHQDDAVCQGIRGADCEICCLNAGYVEASGNGSACVCREG